MGYRLAVLAFGIASLLLLSPNAKADTYLYDFTDNIIPETGSPYTVNIQFTLTATTLPSSGDVSSFTSVTDPYGTVSDFQWNSIASGICEENSTLGMGCTGFVDTVNGTFVNAFPAGDFLSVGTFSGVGATLVITDISAVPEPSSLPLLALGLIGLGVAGRARRWLFRSHHLQKAF